MARHELTTEMNQGHPTAVERKPRDMTEGWIPATKVVSLVLAVVAFVWWLAADHAAIQESRAKADAAHAAVAELTAQQERAHECLRDELEKLRALIGDRRIKEAEVLARLASIEVQCAEIKQMIREKR